MNLYPYQQDCVEAVESAWKTKRSVLFQMATGLGKTPCLAALLDHRDPTGVFVAHLRTLINQAAGEFRKWTTRTVGVEMADHWVPINGLLPTPDVIVTSIQTQRSAHGNGKRWDRIPPDMVTTILLDECHHSSSETMRRFVSRYDGNQDIRIAGCTATPERKGKAALANVFECCAYEYELLDAIRDGWLVNMQFAPRHVKQLDLDTCGLSKGDLSATDLETALSSHGVPGEIGKDIVRMTKGKRTLVFCDSINNARAMTSILNEVTADSARVVCTWDTEDVRDANIRDHRRGMYPYLVNVDVLSEAYDDPEIRCLALCRPTKVQSKYLQQVGRGTRALAGVLHGQPEADERRADIARSAKPSVLVLDYVGNCTKHVLANPANALGKRYSEDIIRRAMKKISEKPRLITDAFDEAEEDVQRQRDGFDHARAVRLANAFKTEGGFIDAFDLFRLPQRNVPKWDTGLALTTKQRDFILRHYTIRRGKPGERCIVDLNHMSRGYASQLIDATMIRFRKHLCTPAQATYLAKMNMPTNVTVEQASAMLDSAWKKKPTRERPNAVATANA